MHSGWKTLLVPHNELCSVLRLELKGVQNNIRVRQLQVLSWPSKTLDSTCLAVYAQQKACESEALRVFRLLTSQVRAGSDLSEAVWKIFNCLLKWKMDKRNPYIRANISQISSKYMYSFFLYHLPYLDDL